MHWQDLIGYEIKSFTPLELREAGPGAIGKKNFLITVINC